MRSNDEITIVVDVDGVVASNNHGDYANAKPFPHAIEAINRMYREGYKVILCTARYNQRYPGKCYQYGYEEALKWLRANEVKFHELHMGKPAGDLYIDDKALQIDSKKGPEEWMPLWSRLRELNNKNRYNEPDQEIQMPSGCCEKSTSFHIGDVVELRSDINMWMTIEDFNASGQAVCVWMDTQDHLQRESFRQAMLQLVVS